jgi:hypothetical protein
VTKVIIITSYIHPFTNAAAHNNFADHREVNADLELVECGALIASSGAAAQKLHADFRRDGKQSVEPILDGAKVTEENAPRPDMPPVGGCCSD